MPQLHARRSSRRSSRLEDRGIYSGPLGFGLQHRADRKKKSPPEELGRPAEARVQGRIQVANPASSGTAYTMVAALVQLMGEDKAFDYMKALHCNIGQYTRGTGPIKAVRAARRRSISFVHDGPGEAMQGFPVATVTPARAPAPRSARCRSSRAQNLDAAKKFYEWALTPQAQEFGAASRKQFQLAVEQGDAVDPHVPDFRKIIVHPLRLRQVRRSAPSASA